MRRIICYVIAGVSVLALLFSWTAQDGQCAESWIASLTVTSDDPIVDPVSLSFGVDPNATAGFDPGLDQPAPPMSPEPIKLDVYFPCPHQYVKRLKVDIRQSADTVLASATFALVGPTTYNGGGTSWTEAQAPAGEYTIACGDVFGTHYLSPVERISISSVTAFPSSS